MHTEVKQSLYTLSEALKLISTSTINSVEDILDLGARGIIRLCFKVSSELGDINLADWRLHWDARAIEVDGEIQEKYEHSRIFLPDHSPIERVIALFLDSSVCGAIQYHGEFPESIFPSAYRIQAYSLSEEITPFDILVHNRYLSDQETQTVKEISELQRFAVFCKTPKENRIETIGEEPIIFTENPRPISIKLTIEKLCLTETELQKLIDLNNVQQEAEPPSETWKPQSHTSKKLVHLNQTASKFWKGKNISEPQEYPNKKDIIEHLIKNECFKDSRPLREAAISIIRPVFSRDEVSLEARSKDSNYLSLELETLKKASDEVWGNADLTDSGTYWTSDAVEELLKTKYQISGKLASPAATIIRPENAKKGRRSGTTTK